jgi:UDP-N-acetylmuramoyl-tripeptide--D-alanyl-D-alanine ligase
MARTLAAVAKAVEGRLVGRDAGFGPVCADTRELAAGSLFVAIRGERFDGNDFVADAAARGAVGALVCRVAENELAQIAVPDTVSAFATMARRWRENFAIPVVAVTGSNGKTTVKELVASIIGVARPVCVTQGNLNNQIGVPLTVMRLAEEHAALVVELGANHPREIDHLSSIVLPTVGVITNAGPAHLEGFGSLDGVAAAKGELLDHLPRAGTAVLNADDDYWSEWRSRSRAGTVVSFGFGPRADCTVSGEPRYDEDGSLFDLRLPDDETISVALPLPGAHNVRNALAAAAAAHAVGAASEDIRFGLERATPVGGRLRSLRGRHGARIIDDSYNANPSSVHAALDHIARLTGQRIFVLGDMGELGADVLALHREVGRYARGKCDALLAIGELAAEAAAAYGAGSVACTDIHEAAEKLEPLLGSDVTVLVKASRAMGLDRLVRELSAPDSRGEAKC